MRFNKEAEEAIKKSREVAIDLGDGYISSYHFLLALVSFENIPHGIFKSKKVDFQDLHHALQKEKLTTVPKNLHLTKEFERSLKISGYYCWVYFDDELKPEQFILAMLADKRSLAGNYLRFVGLGYSDFEAELQQNQRRKLFEMIGKNYFLVKTGFVASVYKLINSTIT